MPIIKNKITAVILVLDIIIGLLLLFFLGNELWEDKKVRFGQLKKETAGRVGIIDSEEHKNGKVFDIEEKKIALTFDDGPHPYYTEQLLDGLYKKGVSVTFFVTGEHASLHPDVIKRMDREGHLIGNHTYSHMQLTKKNRDKFKQELIDTNVIIKEITGETMTYVRPPYGTWDKAIEEELNMIPVLWTVDPLDWCSDNVGCITSNVVEKVQENDIILMHDYYETSVTAALEIVDALLEDGYLFVTVEEILFE